MKVKKQKVGRPSIKDKRVVYAFTIETSKKRAVLNKTKKKDLDNSFRLIIDKIILQ